MIRFESPRLRPKETQVRVISESTSSLYQNRRPGHIRSLDYLYMEGKIISRSFQWCWFEAQIHSQSMGIVETSEHPESVRVSRHNLLGRSPIYRVGAHRGVSRGVIHELTLIYSLVAATLGFVFCFEFSFSIEKLNRSL